MSAAEARAFPEFGPHGQLHFFVPSPWIPAPEPERLRPPGRAARSRWRRCARRPAALRFAAAPPRGARPPGGRAVRLRGRAALAVPALPAAPLHLSPARLLRDLDRRRAPPGVESLVGGSRARAAAFVLAPVAIAVLAVCAFPLGPVAPLARAGPAVAVAILAAVAAVASPCALPAPRRRGRHRGGPARRAARAAALRRGRFALPERPSSPTSAPCPRTP